MKIVADRAIPFLAQCFTGVDELVLLDSASIDRKSVRDADVLVVRTVTRVGPALLEGSTVKLVATASSGVDHVDTEYLRRRGTALVDARGCNASAVAEYVLGAVCAMADGTHFESAGRRVGIVGCGHAGSAVHRFLAALGFECRLNDPPLRDSGSTLPLLDMAELCDVDILTLHVPLTDAGAYPTRHLLGRELLARLRPDVIIINTARGEAVDETALAAFLDANPAARAVIDVWSGEPAVNVALLDRTAVATPHIAGYSADAKLRATLAVSRQVRDFLGLPRETAAIAPLPAPDPAVIDVSGEAGDLDAVRAAVLGSYDVRRDAAQMSGLRDAGEIARSEMFASLRARYPLRREFCARTVRMGRDRDGLSRLLGTLGFGTDTDG